MISKFPQSADIGVLCVSTSVTKSFCFFSTFKSQGGREDLQGSAQRSSLQDPRKRKLITSVYLLVLPQAVTPLFHFLIHGLHVSTPETSVLQLSCTACSPPLSSAVTHKQLVQPFK